MVVGIGARFAQVSSLSREVDVSNLQADKLRNEVLEVQQRNMRLERELLVYQQSMVTTHHTTIHSSGVGGGERVRPLCWLLPVL